MPIYGKQHFFMLACWPAVFNKTLFRGLAPAGSRIRMKSLAAISAARARVEPRMGRRHWNPWSRMSFPTTKARSMKARRIRRGRGRGYRKAILINEHFVVYGVPAVAVPLFRPVLAAVTAREGPGLQVLIRSKPGEEARASSDPNLLQAVRNILATCGLSGEETLIRMECRGFLPGWSGLGSSAAFCVASARALSQAFHLSWSDEQVNAAAYEGEKVFARNPSGIDNSVSTFGRVLWYCRGQAEPWQFLSPGAPFWFVIANTGIPSLTRDQIEKVARFRETHPSRFQELCLQASDLALRVRSGLETGMPADLGRWMDQGHHMLCEIGASSHEVEGLVEHCRSRGALGAKLTGAGGGGCVIALVRSRARGSNLTQSLRDLGYGAFSVRVGDPVRVPAHSL